MKRMPQQFNLTGASVKDRVTGEEREIDNANPPQIVANRAKAVILSMETGKAWKVVESA